MCMPHCHDGLQFTPLGNVTPKTCQSHKSCQNHKPGLRIATNRGGGGGVNSGIMARRPKPNYIVEPRLRVRPIARYSAASFDPVLDYMLHMYKHVSGDDSFVQTRLHLHSRYSLYALTCEFKCMMTIHSIEHVLRDRAISSKATVGQNKLLIFKVRQFCHFIFFS